MIAHPTIATDPAFALPNNLGWVIVRPHPKAKAMEWWAFHKGRGQNDPASATGLAITHQGACRKAIRALLALPRHALLHDWQPFDMEVLA